MDGQRTENKKKNGRTYQNKRERSISLQQVKRRKEGEKGQRDGLNMSLHVSGPALNYNEGKKKSLVMASLEYIILALMCGEEGGEGEGENERDITVIYSLR